MQLNAAIQGDLRRIMAEETQIIREGAMQGLRDTARAAQAKLRQQTESAGLGRRVANAWRMRVFPHHGTADDAAALIWSRAPDIIRGNMGAVIRGRDGTYLAIPTPAAPKRVAGKRVTPGRLEAAWGIVLRMVYVSPVRSYLVAELRARRGRRGGFTPASATAKRTGRGLATVVLFTLHRQVRLPARIDRDGVAVAAERALPAAVVRGMAEVETRVRAEGARR